MYDIYTDKTFPFQLVKEENERIRLSWILDYDNTYPKELVEKENKEEYYRIRNNLSN